MAQQPPPPPPESSSEPLRPGTYRSLLPIVDEILSILHAQTVTPERVSPAQASEQVAPKAKELSSALEGMKTASMDLPGGHLSTDEIEGLIGVLDEEGEKRRRVLRAFESLEMPSVDSLWRERLGGAETGAVTAAPTPK
ncbi:hypothetical protein IAT38_007689 [Cryptococcus sp. DSM 104549]